MHLKLDLHLHSIHSGEAFGTIEEIVLRAKSVGLDGFALTDHNSIAGNKEARRIAKKHGLIFIPACEIKSREGDIIALGIKKEIPEGLSAEETIARIHTQGALAVAAHPFAIFLHPRCGVGKRVYDLELDAIEVFNARTYRGNGNALQAANKLKLAKTAGSDAHTLEEIGNAYTVVDCRKNVKSVLGEIKAGRTEIFGKKAKRRHIITWMARKILKRL